MGNCFCITFQGSLKEKTVENLEKYVVKDVSKPDYSDYYTNFLLTSVFVTLFHFVCLLIVVYSLQTSFLCLCLQLGQITIASKPNERSCQSVPCYQQWLQVHRCELF